jgi:predicted transcriptional regulator
MSEIPKVFISYSHDSQEHKKWVLDLATRLRNNGIDAIIDMWELKAGDDIPHFMERNLENSTFVVMVCTKRYVEKANAGTGGVGYEKMIITSNYLANINQQKVIPIVRQNGINTIPTFLKSKLYIDFSNNDDFEYAYDDLVRRIHAAPLFIKPEIGNNPFVAPSQLRENKTGDGVLEFMKAVVHFYNNRNGANSSTIAKKMNVTRLMAEMLREKAAKEGLIDDATHGIRVTLTPKGKLYALENNLL